MEGSGADVENGISMLKKYNSIEKSTSNITVSRDGRLGKLLSRPKKVPQKCKLWRIYNIISGSVSQYILAPYQLHRTFTPT